MCSRTATAVEQEDDEDEDIQAGRDHQDVRVYTEVAFNHVERANSCTDECDDTQKGEGPIAPLKERRNHDTLKLERNTNHNVAHDQNTKKEVNDTHGIHSTGYFDWSKHGLTIARINLFTITRH